jgi:hypothetical protein
MQETRPRGRNRGVVIALVIAFAPILLFVFGRAGLRLLATDDGFTGPSFRGPVGIRQSAGPAAARPTPPEAPPRDPAEAAARKWGLFGRDEAVGLLRQLAARFHVEPEAVASQAVYTTLLCHDEQPASKKRSDDVTAAAALRSVEASTRPPAPADQRAFVAAFWKYVAAGCLP